MSVPKSGTRIVRQDRYCCFELIARRPTQTGQPKFSGTTESLVSVLQVWRKLMAVTPISRTAWITLMPIGGGRERQWRNIWACP